MAETIPELILTHFWWAHQVLMTEYPDIEKMNIEHYPPGTTIREVVAHYLIWAVMNQVLHVFGTPAPVALVLIRRLQLSKIDYYQDNYYPTFLEQDKDGDLTYVDFCYAPDNYPFIIRFLKSRGTQWIGWTHESTGKLHIKAARVMPDFSAVGKGGSLSQFIDRLV